MISSIYIVLPVVFTPLLSYLADFIIIIIIIFLIIIVQHFGLNVLYN